MLSLGYSSAQAPKHTMKFQLDRNHSMAHQSTGVHHGNVRGLYWPRPWRCWKNPPPVWAWRWTTADLVPWWRDSLFHEMVLTLRRRLVVTPAPAAYSQETQGVPLTTAGRSSLEGSFIPARAVNNTAIRPVMGKWVLVRRCTTAALFARKFSVENGTGTAT